LLLSVHEFEAARDRYKQAYENFQELKSFSGQASSLLGMAQLYQAQRNYDQAFEALDRVLDLSQKEERALFEITALDELAKLHRLLGQKALASTRFNRALQIADQRGAVKRTVTLLQSHAAILSEMSVYDEAVELLDKAIEIDPANPYIYSDKGWALQYIGKERAEESRQAYEKASELRPNNLWIHKGIANALRVAGNRPAANEKYRWVVDQIESMGRKTTDLPTLGWSYYHLGEYVKAEQIYRQVVESYPEPISDYFDLGLILLCLGKKDEALQCYQEGIKHLQLRFPERRRLGLIYVALADLQEAEALTPKSFSMEGDALAQEWLKEQWKLAFGEDRQK
jgi:tetratricopeptide (TPR) repeat protein